MKNIEISLVVRAESVNNAEHIAMRELMELAKAVAKRKGASMGQGCGNASPITSDAYQVNATVALNCDANVNDILAEVQNIWMNKPEIVHSAFAVAEEEPEVKRNTVACFKCCEIIDKDDAHIINPGTAGDEYKLCDECWENALNNGDIGICPACEESIDVLIENPVTHEKNICPCCGETL